MIGGIDHRIFETIPRTRLSNVYGLNDNDNNLHNK